MSQLRHTGVTPLDCHLPAGATGDLVGMSNGMVRGCRALSWGAPWSLERVSHANGTVEEELGQLGALWLRVFQKRRERLRQSQGAPVVARSVLSKQARSLSFIQISAQIPRLPGLLKCTVGRFLGRSSQPLDQKRFPHWVANSLRESPL